MKIQIQHLSGEQWNVVVQDAVKTEHHVRVTQEDLQRFGNEKISTEQLLQESFRFLLERESNESILREFDLSTIIRYFPDYESIIRHRIAKAQ